jgi:hypothetical protein
MTQVQALIHQSPKLNRSRINGLLPKEMKISQHPMMMRNRSMLNPPVMILRAVWQISLALLVAPRISRDSSNHINILSIKA